MNSSFVTRADMNLALFTSPENLPISFVYDGMAVHGIPSSYSPRCEMHMLDANLQQYVVEGENADGLHIRVEMMLYRDYPVTEFLAFFENRGSCDSAILSNVRILDGVIPCGEAALIHGNGETLQDDGYEWFRTPMTESIELAPQDGTACNGAFPYMRLQGKTWGVNIAVGWPAMWHAKFAPAGDGVHVSIGQLRCRSVLHPGETLRTPRASLLAYEGDEARGTNMWRRWYLAHILPRENGQPLPPKCCMHVFEAKGMPEFTGADEDNQVGGLRDYLARGIHPDIWWLDAGWYPCGGDWTELGDWKPDPARFPHGLAPVGKACDQNGVQLLLWFEPERAREGSPLANEHPEWMLRWKQEDGSLHRNCMVNLGNRACCDWVIDRVDSIIKEGHVRIYRQDLNFEPRPYWVQAEAEDRVGMVENLHVQGYLRFWDALIERNPGLWIDSCAAGGRRNDLETMRRAVPLHYTDIGYGHHPVKQKQHFQMFAWIPYFRAHNMNWLDPATGEYGKRRLPVDRYSYYCAMTPALTDLLEHDASEADYALAREMQPIWRKAAERMLSCDYYPLTTCRKSAEDWYAVQFHSPEKDHGFVEFIRNVHAKEDSFTCCLHGVMEDHLYLLTDPESGERLVLSGAALKNGLTVELPAHSGRIYFYERKAASV